MTSTEIIASDAREIASVYGTIIGVMEPREDGGWDALVETDNGEIVVSVVMENGEIVSFA